MNMTARRGRRIRKLRRRGHQVLATVPKDGGFQLLYWTPKRFAHLPRGVK